MGYAFSFPRVLELGAILFFQCWIARSVLARASRRARAIAAVFGVWLFIGILLGLRILTNNLPFSAWWIGWWHGAAYLWACLSTATFLVHRLLSLVTLPRDPTRRLALRAAAGGLLAAPTAITGYGIFVERFKLRVREVDVAIANLPPDLEGLRLTQLSDIHLSAFLSEPDLARAVDAANETRPHIALVTGDLISIARDPLDRCLTQLARLRADAGVLGCMGNHERYTRAEAYTETQAARRGIDFLRQRARALRFGSGVVNFGGVDYQKIGSRDTYLRGAESLLAPGALNILLSHSPDVFPVAARQGWNLTVSGHTHGGQVTLEILEQTVNPARFYTPYVYGLYRDAAAAMYVTRGIGTIGIPVRLGALPEIAVIRLKRA